MSLEQDLAINSDDLGKEWVQIPNLYFKYKEETELIDSRIRKKKAKLDLRIAKIDVLVRSDPSNYLGSSKVTEVQIRSYIDTQDEIFQMRMEILDLEKEKKVLAAACESLEMKRDALRSLTSLANGEYYSSITALPSTQQDDSRNIRREIHSRLNKKKEIEE